MAGIVIPSKIGSSCSFHGNAPYFGKNWPNWNIFTFFNWGWTVCANMFESVEERKCNSSFSGHFTFFYFLHFFNSFGYHFEVILFNGTDMVIPGVFVNFLIR